MFNVEQTASELKSAGINESAAWGISMIASSNINHLNDLIVEKFKDFERNTIAQIGEKFREIGSQLETNISNNVEKQILASEERIDRQMSELKGEMSELKGSVYRGFGISLTITAILLSVLGYVMHNDHVANINFFQELSSKVIHLEKH